MSMNARDYTHKRFRSGSSGTASSPVKASPIGQSPNRGDVKSYYKIGPLPGEMMDSSSSSFDSSGPPRLVTPTHNHHSNNNNNNSNNHKATLSPTPKHRDSNSPGSPLVHTPTATSGGLTQVSRDVSSIDANKNNNSNNSSSNKYFSLDAVKPSDLSADHPAHSPFRGDDYDNPPTSAKSNKLKDAHSQAIQNHNLSDSLSKSTAGSATTGSKIVQQDPNAYKIFLLLLQPKSKIFELIQIIYSPFDTTIGHILQMIPDNATEPALGTQHYIGLCRPKQQQELLDTELLASEPRPGADVPTARISLGEILVAIPNGYTGQDVAYLSKQILANPKIVKLLKRADPLARRNKHRSSRRHGNRSSRAVERVHVLEKHDEAEEEFLHNYNSSHHHHHHQNNASSPPRASKTTSSPIFRENNNEQEDVERLMQLALDNAAAEAAAANAAIPGGRPSLANYSSTRNLKANSTFDRDLPGVRRTQSNDESIDPHHHHHNNNNNNHHQHHVSEQLSIDDSYSSWSKSFDASFSGQPGGSICSGASKRVARRRERHARRVRILQRSALIGVVAMIAFYVLDPKNSQQQQQQQRQAEQLPYSIDVQAQTPMGIMGIFQCLFLLLTLYKAERLFRSAREAEQRGTLNNSNAGPDAFYMSEERRCPFLKASAKALKRFKHKYSKRLKRQQQQQSNANAVAATSVITTATTTGGSGEEGNYPYNYNGSTKLRSFPLKASSGGIPTTTTITTSKLFGSSS